MPSLWPFRRNSQTPAGYEKHLARLSTRIHASSTTLAHRRAQARRLRALWTLYASTGYLVYLIVALLAIGWQAWRIYEIAGLAGGPVAIYGVRRGLDVVMGFFVKREEERLQALKTERTGVIKDLKEATGYDRTRGLLDKYGGEKQRAAEGEDGDEEGSGAKQGQRIGAKQQQQPQRTDFMPPPTANIPSRQSLPGGAFASGVSTPSPAPHRQQDVSSAPSSPDSKDGLAASASFAPNAFPDSSASHPAPINVHAMPNSPYGPFTPALDMAAPTKWYDRLLDVLIGDDESAARNRLALLCSSCGLVNGLAPPGARSLEEVGKWKCSGCGATNGVAAEDQIKVKRAMTITEEDQHAGRKSQRTQESSSSRNEIADSEDDADVQDDEESDRTIYSNDGEEEQKAEAKEEKHEKAVSAPARSTRSRAKKS